MVCLDQPGDDRGDSLGYLRMGRVEVYPELSPLDPFHDSAIDQQQFRVSRHRNLQGKRHPDGDRFIPDNVAPAQRKIFDDSCPRNSVPKVPYRHQFLEPLMLPHDKPGHSVSFLSRSRLRTEHSSDGRDPFATRILQEHALVRMSSILHFLRTEYAVSNPYLFISRTRYFCGVLSGADSEPRSHRNRRSHTMG